VKHFPNAPLYDATVLRTFFIELENPNWEAELVTFNNTDVEIPARVTVDGKVYPDVGIHFRGNSSFGVGDGYKRSLNLTFDFVHENQAILGYRTLNLLNANDDPTFLRTVLSLHIARQYIPAPKANLVRVVINGENWGIYANAQQFNREFLSDNFKTTQGTRWKVPQGGGGGIGAFSYVDQDANSYRNVFQIKSKDQPAAWTSLIELARTLQQTPTEQLEAALAPMLDIDGYLRFLALDNAMVNGDGFYTRGADYSLYLDPNGRFHLMFYDVNEMFSSGGGGRGGGPGGGGRGEGGGTALNPLAAQNDTSKPIISRILAVPSLRAKYLGGVREIAEKSFDWKTLGPVVKQYRDLISDDVARDTRKLYATDQFLAGTADELSPGSLRSFFEQRRKFLLNWSEPGAPRTSP
jgi:spore coat protein CotH